MNEHWTTSETSYNNDQPRENGSKIFLNCFKCLKCGVWVVVNVTSDGGDDEVRPDQCGW